VKVNGKSFDGTTHTSDTQNRLRTTAGNASWFTEYQAVGFPRCEHTLLSEFFLRHIYVVASWVVLLNFGNVTLVWGFLVVLLPPILGVE
jgi:hypothetical protein